MSPMEVGIQRMNDRLALAAHEPATWLWLAFSVAAIVVYGLPFPWLRPWDELESWLALAAGGCVAWILFGWMFEVMTLDARGHLSFMLGWEYPVVFAVPLAAAEWLLSRSQIKPELPSARSATDTRSYVGR